jgi:hypothetical protein
VTLRCRAEVAEGDELPGLHVRVTRAGLVRYAGASGDFNPIHWNQRVAREVGLPDVVAHGGQGHRHRRPSLSPAASSFSGLSGVTGTRITGSASFGLVEFGE